MDAVTGDAADWFAGCFSSANGFEFRLDIGAGASPSWRLLSMELRRGSKAVRSVVD